MSAPFQLTPQATEDLDGIWWFNPSLIPLARYAGIVQAAAKRFRAVILSLFAVILSAAKNLALPLRVNFEKDLALSIFMAMRDSSSPAAPQNDSLEAFFRRLCIPEPRING